MLIILSWRKSERCAFCVLHIAKVQQKDGNEMVFSAFSIGKPLWCL